MFKKEKNLITQIVCEELKYSSTNQSTIFRQAVLASPGNLSEIQNLRSQCQPTESKSVL